ncbi:MAG: AAA family ATPase [Clostridia bacterium]|nr:AAA family ATPase [Clostridia bacterium]
MIKYMGMETTTASEDFKRNIQDGKRYVDKSLMLCPLLRRAHETTFFLRPRRFGKTLALSMIRYFVEDTRDEDLNAENRSLFQGLRIMNEGDFYTNQMTSYPVIHLTMQTVKGMTFDETYEALQSVLSDLYQEKLYLLECGRLTETDRLFFERIVNGKDSSGRQETRTDIKRSLQKLSEMLYRESGMRTVVLIDEYDVPLENAYRNGFYHQMVNIVGPLFQNALKSNSRNLQFAVITGCLRIAKEGIYTGLNNPEINSVLSRGQNDSLGFTESEVRYLLSSSGIEDKYPVFEEWYDGYQFDQAKIYNPWSVIKYIQDLEKNPDSPPMLYWGGTSSNEIIRELAEKSDLETKKKAELLMQGESVSFALRENIVYDELFTHSDNVFNVMLASGYLTAVQADACQVIARIPNHEVLCIFRNMVREWFEDTLFCFDVRALYHAFEEGKPEQAERILTDSFLSAMSFYDTQEAFYHGIMLALLQQNSAYFCSSNGESGKGRFDVQCKQRSGRALAFVLEVKISRTEKRMIGDAVRGAEQIRTKKYAGSLLREGYKCVLTYGIAFCQKTCRIVQGNTFVPAQQK